MQLYDSNEYRASKDWPYAISAGCVVYRESGGDVEILLLVREAGAFPQLPNGHIDTHHLPKGHVEISETLEQTALRETSEEAGVKVEITTYLGAHLNKYSDTSFKQEKTIHYFAGKWLSDLEFMDDEHSKKVWVKASEAIELTSSNPKKENELIENLLKFLELTRAS